jgi:hypothetical protein
MKRLEKPNWQREKERTNFIVLGVIGGLIAVLVLAGAIYVISGIEFSETNVLADGVQIKVKAGGDFQAALDQAKSGDTIILQAGAEYIGNFKLPKKNGNEFITIRTSASDARLPGKNERIDPKKYARLLPRLSSGTTDAVINTVDGSHHYRFIGIEFGGTKNGENNIIQIGSTEEEKIEDIPHHIEFDRVYIHATSPEGQRRGIAANGRHIIIKNSHISGIRRKGFESQAIAVWAGDGPVAITNNYLEGAGENILFGGAGSRLKLVPTNCLVKDNHLNKPLEWRNEGWVVKNLFEIKNGRRIKVENNLMTNNWAMGQDGTAVLFTVREDNGKASIIEEIDFTGNIIRGSGNALNIYGEEGSGGHRLTIKNNFFIDINGKKWGGGGHFMISTDWNGLTIENNTVIQNGNISNAYGEPVRGFIFRNNIIFNNEYGFIGDSMSPGKPTLNRFFPKSIIEKNIIFGGSPSWYGKDNFYPTSIRQIGFKDFVNYELKADSPYRKRGTDGSIIGAEMNHQ